MLECRCSLIVVSVFLAASVGFTAAIDMSTRVCAVGENTSQLAAAYLEFVVDGDGEGVDGAGGGGGGAGHGRGREEQLKKAFQRVNLPVSTNQACRILEEAQEQRGGEEENAVSTLSWGEFCVFCAEMHPLAANPSQRATNQSQVVESGSREPKREGPHRRPGCKHDVFLGGSCNPTTWRKDAAIPVLQREGVTYFNPQVEEWSPELIEIEEQAKQAATMHLFVIDNQTRAVASMVEIAYLAGINRQLVVVVQDIEGDNPRIGSDIPSRREVEDLNRGRAFVRNLSEHSGSILESTVAEAVETSVKIMKSLLHVSEYAARHRPICLAPSHTLGEELRLLRQVFVMYDTDRKGQLSMQEAELALKSLHIDTPGLFQLLSSKNGSQANLSSWQQHGIPFEDFCSIYAELKCQLMQTKQVGSVAAAIANLAAPLMWIADWIWPSPSSPPPPPPFCDVFLGGSCGSTTWRKDVVIPILRQHGVSYFNPQVPRWDTQLIPIEREAKDRCSVLLFVVSGDTLSVATLVEVAYFIGQGRKLVLCLNDIPQSENPVVDGIKLSKQGLKDYNRGRAYLASIANKSRVPIFTSPADSAMSVVYMVKGYKAPPIHAVPLSGTSV